MSNVKGKMLVTGMVPVAMMLDSDRKATIASLTVNLNGTVYAATGSSWRDAGDSYNERTGNLLAVSRAVEELRDVLKAEAAKVH